MNAVPPTLIYFDVRGRAEPIKPESSVFTPAKNTPRHADLQHSRNPPALGQGGPHTTSTVADVANNLINQAMASIGNVPSNGLASTLIAHQKHP